MIKDDENENEFWGCDSMGAVDFKLVVDVTGCSEYLAYCCRASKRGLSDI